jgi:hypothetical protein
VKPLGNMLRKLHYRRLQIDQAKLTINIAMFRAILQCILQENTRFDLASSAASHLRNRVVRIFPKPIRRLKPKERPAEEASFDCKYNLHKVFSARYLKPRLRYAQFLVRHG